MPMSERKFALIDPKDDVIIALSDLKKGEVVDGITLLDDVPQAHKIARSDLPKGHLVIKYGNVIGKLSHDVKKGEWIHSHNLVTSLEGEAGEYTYNKGGITHAEPSKKTWWGYLREDGRAGTRNDLFIVPTVGCINSQCQYIKDLFLQKHPEMEGRVKVLEHPYGCSQLGDDLENTARLLSSLAKSPNAGASLIVSLGCENNRLDGFLKLMEPYDHKRIVSYECQKVEDDIAYGLEKLESLYEIIKDEKRVELPLSKLVLGGKCGGSDGFSGLTGNPLLGLVADKIGASGGKVMLTEVPEMFGAEQDLMNRAKDEKTFEKVVALINDFKAYYARNNQPCYENPSPGNKDGGITTLEEKSNGCILKGGHLEIEDVIGIGEPIKANNLTLVNGPGNDIVAVTNLAASGANIIVFTTGRGTPLGSIVPTLKLATNHKLAKNKANWIDFDAETAFDIGFPEASELLLDKLLEIASGKPARHEEHSLYQIALFKTGVTL